MNEILIGKTNDGIKIAVPNNLRCGHVQVIGATGRGKTESVIIPWMMQDMFQGNCTVLIDGKGDKSIYTLLEAVNREEGLNETLAYFDIANISSSMTTNPLKYGSSQQLVDRIFSSLEFDNSYFKVVSENACHFVIKLIHAQNDVKNQEVKFKTLFDALTDDSKLSELFLGVSENLSKNFEGDMSQFLNQKFSDRQEKVSGFLAQISPLACGELAEIINGSVNGKAEFSLSEIFCPKVRKNNLSNKVHSKMTCNVPKVAVLLLPTLLYQQSASILGKIFLQEIAWSIASREALGDKEFSSLFLDEFGSFVYPGFLGLLNKARSAKLAVHISHQSLGDLSEVSDSFAQAIHTNTNIKCILGVNDPITADFFAKHLGTLDIIEATERAEKDLFGDYDKSGSLNIRQSEAYKIHPNNLKNYSQGKGIISFINNGDAIAEEIQFLRSPFRLKG